jgi:hypothetical protein
VAAAHAGSEFRSTGRVTVFKFNSAFRYLSYLLVEAQEQSEMLALCSSPADVMDFINERVRVAQRNGHYMTRVHPNPAEYVAGEIQRAHEQVRGIHLPQLTEVLYPVEIAFEQSRRGFDWHAVEGNEHRSWMWSGPSTRPRLAIPYTSAMPVTLTFHVERFITHDVKQSLRIFVNAAEVTPDMTSVEYDDALDMSLTVTLLPDKASIVEFQMSGTVSPASFGNGSTDARQLGICLKGWRIEPTVRHSAGN